MWAVWGGLWSDCIRTCTHTALRGGGLLQLVNHAGFGHRARLLHCFIPAPTAQTPQVHGRRAAAAAGAVGAGRVGQGRHGEETGERMLAPSLLCSAPTHPAHKHPCCSKSIPPPAPHHLLLFVQAMRPRLGTELEEATAEWMQAAAAARRARHAAAAKERSNIVMYAAAATAAPLLGASMLLAAAALGMAGGGSVDFV